MILAAAAVAITALEEMAVLEEGAAQPLVVWLGLVATVAVAAASIQVFIPAAAVLRAEMALMLVAVVALWVVPYLFAKEGA